MSDIVEDISKALEGITPGKWEWTPNDGAGYYDDKYRDLLGSNAVISPTIVDHGYDATISVSDADAALIAASPDLLQRAKDEIVRLREEVAELYRQHEENAKHR